MSDRPTVRPRRRRSRVALGVALSVVIALGLASRVFSAFLPEIIAANAGDALWTVAVYLSLALVAPSWSPLRLGALAFGLSVGVELSQLVDVAWLNALRATLPGRLLLGAGVLWADLARYLLGAAVATALDVWLVTGRPSKRSAACPGRPG